MMHHIKRLAKKKSVIGGAIAMAVTGTIIGTQFNQPAQATKYVLGQVTRGTVVASISGSGQVSGQNQVEVTPAVSGAITKVFVKAGDTVTEGTPLFEIDRKLALRTVRDAQQSVRDAELSLQSTELSYKKFVAPADQLELVKAQNAVNQAQRSLDDLKEGADPLDIKQAEADLATQMENTKLSADGKTPKVIRDAYDDAVPELKSLSQDLRESLYDADEILGIDDVSKNDAYEGLLSVLDSSRLALARASYINARQKILDLKNLVDSLDPLNEDAAKIESALVSAEAALRVAEPLLQQTYEVLLSTLTSSSFSQGTLDGLRSRMQSDHSAIANELRTINTRRDSIDDAKTALANAERNVEKARDTLEKLKRGADKIDLDLADEKLMEAQATLDDLRKGPDAIDIAVQQNTVAQRRSSLQSARDRLNDAQETLNDYTIRAPFDGVVVTVTGKQANQVSPSTEVATILTQAKMVTLPLNEVDIAKIKSGQKATVTFDAVSDLSIAATVTEVDAIGTTNQGVVTYNVDVAFLTEDERIKPGMSASVAIATDVRTDVLTVPNAAIRNGSLQVLPSVKEPSAEAQTQGIASDTPPEPLAIETGLANDQSTEIVSGVKEGDWIVVRTITPSATTAAAKTNSLLPTGGNAVRMQSAGSFTGSGQVFRVETR
jgi:multidrug efflux pump subunit AcrA (membrane-fusion protein)